MSNLPLGSYIAELRKLRGKTQKELADALHYTPQAISKIERGEGSFPLSTAVDFCRYFNCSLDSLYQRELPPAPFEYDKDRIDFSALGKALVAARVDAGCSQQEWASRIGSSPKSIRKYENNEQIPPYFVWERYCDEAKRLPRGLLNIPVHPTYALKSTRKPRPALVAALAISAAIVAATAIGVPIGISMNRSPSPHHPIGGASGSEASSSLSEPSASSVSSVVSSSEPPVSTSSESMPTSIVSGEESSENESSIISSEESTESSSSEESTESLSSEESSAIDSSESSIESIESSESSMPKVYITGRTNTTETKVLTLPDDYVTYELGNYPQEAVTDAGLIAELSALEGSSTVGTTLEHGGKRYLVANCVANTKTTTGVALPAGKQFFHYSPIKWVHCADAEGLHFLVSESTLFVKSFTDYPVYREDGGLETEVWNNYEHSTIRSYLNDEFYNSVFSAEEKTKILLTHVDNSVGTTINPPNTNLSNDTDDYVYLPACNEMNLGGSDKRFRRSLASDYFRAQGGRYETDDSAAGAGNSFYWLRSPYSKQSDAAYERVCSPIGMIYATYDHDSVPYNATFINDEDWDSESGPYGIRPMITVASFPL